MIYVLFRGTRPQQEEKMTDEKFTFFWHGVFSQWYASKFIINDIEYNRAEQYMMAQKAIMFGDDEMLEKIMGTNDPKTQKTCGRNVKDFDPNKWNQYAKAIVHDGNMAKFTQNPKFLEDLIATEGTTLVEASPYDKIWGIGMGVDNPKSQNRETWKGLNWLGEVLTGVREIIICSSFKLVWDMRNEYTTNLKYN